MNGYMVGMRDYEGFGGGFGMASQEHVEELQKALTAGYQQPRHDGGNALRVESLEQTLRVLTFTQQHIRFWRDIPKLPAYSTSEEYTIQTAYGGENGPFTNEGELPQTQDSAYERRVALVKFMGTQREVTHPATLVKPAHGNAIAMQTMDGGVWILERIERSLFAGRSDIVPQSFDGIDYQIQSDGYAQQNNVIDLRGGVLTQDAIEDGTNQVIENYGVPSDLYLAPKALSNMAKQYYPKERVQLGAGPEGGMIGMAFSKSQTQAGEINLKGNIFLRSARNNGVKTVPLSATSSRAPSAPTHAGVAGANAASLFVAADAGNYRFRVTAVNRFGESAPSASAAVAVVAGDGVTVTITDGGGADPATGYRVYRSNVGGAANSEMLIGEIQRASSGTTAFLDVNQYLPGMSRAYLLQVNLQSMSFRQLAPMMKIPLATLAASIRWMQLLYGTPIVYAPKKNVIFINVKDS